MVTVAVQQRPSQLVKMNDGAVQYVHLNVGKLTESSGSDNIHSESSYMRHSVICYRLYTHSYKGGVES